MIVPAWWFTEQVTVETYQGPGTYGDTYAAPVVVLGNIAGGETVQWASTGSEVVASQVVMLPNPCRLADGSGTVDPSAVLTPQSRVTSGVVVSQVGSVDLHREPASGALLCVFGHLAR